MAFLSRVFKNLQWYGMTKSRTLGCGTFFHLFSSQIPALR